MKSRKRSCARGAALVLLTLVALAANRFAASHPPNSPVGLALDAKGNLRAANLSANQVLVCEPNDVQMSGKTIMQNISVPTGVAV